MFFHTSWSITNIYHHFMETLYLSCFFHTSWLLQRQWPRHISANGVWDLARIFDASALSHCHEPPSHVVIQGASKKRGIHSQKFRGFQKTWVLQRDSRTLINLVDQWITKIWNPKNDVLQGLWNAVKPILWGQATLGNARRSSTDLTVARQLPKLAGHAESKDEGLPRGLH